MMLAFDQDHLVGHDGESAQHAMGLVGADLGVQNGDLDSGLGQDMLQPMLQNRVLCGFPVGSNLIRQIVVEGVAMDTEDAGESEGFDRSK